MAEKTHGNVTITYGDHIQIPDEAGTLASTDLARLEKARRGVGITAVLTAAALRKQPDLAPKGVTADELEALGKQADDLDLVISDLESLLGTMKQANLLIDSKTHESLRKVLANVRSLEKFNAGVVDDVPQLVAYFKNTRAAKSTAE
jgi:hypothetical protein